jgi:hypothetical protein
VNVDTSDPLSKLDALFHYGHGGWDPGEEFSCMTDGNDQWTRAYKVARLIDAMELSSNVVVPTEFIPTDLIAYTKALIGRKSLQSLYVHLSRRCTVRQMDDTDLSKRIRHCLRNLGLGLAGPPIIGVNSLFRT